MADEMPRPKGPSATAKTTLYIQRDLYKKARQLALSQDRTFTDVVHELLTKYVKRK